MAQQGTPWFKQGITRQLLEYGVDGLARVLPPAKRHAFRTAWRPHTLGHIGTSPTIEGLRQLKNSRQGERCILAGTAPSIDRIDLGRIEDDFVFLVNRGYLLRDRLNKPADALMIANSHAFHEYGRQALAHDWTHVFLSSELSAPPTGAIHDIRFAEWSHPRQNEGFFQLDCTRPLYHANTVVILALQMAVWMGFSEIIIVGVDLSFDRSNPHFYKTYGKELKRSRSNSIVKSDRMQDGFYHAAQYIAQYTNCKVYNASAGGCLEHFPRMAWEKLFQDTGNDALLD